jgi:hypothetical protein
MLDVGIGIGGVGASRIDLDVVAQIERDVGANDLLEAGPVGNLGG